MRAIECVVSVVVLCLLRCVGIVYVCGCVRACVCVCICVCMCVYVPYNSHLHTQTGFVVKAPPNSASDHTVEATSPRRSMAPRASVQAVKAGAVLIREGGTIFKFFKPRFVVLNKVWR